MRHFLVFFIIIVMTAFIITIPDTSLAQQDKVRKSLPASVTQKIGADTDITFNFSRPGVKGRKIWGDVVPFGLYPGNKYSKEKPYPWRAGADENTTIEFNNDLKIEGNKIAAGKYSIHMIVGEQEWQIMFNKKSDLWGSYAYDEKEDILRIRVKPQEALHQEWLIFGFEDLEGTRATAFLHWEKVKVPFKVELDK
jgi:hypothetical protein